MSKRILLVGIGGLLGRAVRVARALGLGTIVLAPAGHTGEEANDRCVGDPTDPQAIAHAARAHGVQGICPLAPAALLASASAAAELGLPGPGPEAARFLSDAGGARARLFAQGVAVVEGYLSSSRDEAEAAGKRLGTPLLVRPAAPGEDPSPQVVDYLEDMCLAFLQVERRSLNKSVLLERYFGWAEYDFYGLLHEGKLVREAICGIEVSGPPYLVDAALFIPAPLPKGDQEAICSVSRAALDAIGYRNGAVHLRLALTGKGPVVVGIGHACVAGPHMVELLRLAYGADCTADLIRVALGEAPQVEEAALRGAACCWIPARSGFVERITGAEEALAAPGVETVAISVRPGDQVGHIADRASRDRIGYVLASGDSAEEALTAARNAVGLIKIVTRASPP